MLLFLILSKYFLKYIVFVMRFFILYLEIRLEKFNFKYVRLDVNILVI